MSDSKKKAVSKFLSTNRGANQEKPLKPPERKDDSDSHVVCLDSDDYESIDEEEFKRPISSPHSPNEPKYSPVLQLKDTSTRNTFLMDNREISPIHRNEKQQSPLHRVLREDEEMFKRRKGEDSWERKPSYVDELAGSRGDEKWKGSALKVSEDLWNEEDEVGSGKQHNSPVASRGRNRLKRKHRDIYYPYAGYRPRSPDGLEEGIVSGRTFALMAAEFPKLSRHNLRAIEQRLVKVQPQYRTQVMHNLCYRSNILTTFLKTPLCLSTHPLKYGHLEHPLHKEYIQSYKTQPCTSTLHQSDCFGFCNGREDRRRVPMMYEGGSWRRKCRPMELLPRAVQAHRVYRRLLQVLAQHE